MQLQRPDFGDLAQDVHALRVPELVVGEVVGALREDVGPPPTVRRQSDLGVARIERVDQGSAGPQQVLLDRLVVKAKRERKNKMKRKSGKLRFETTWINCREDTLVSFGSFLKVATLFYTSAQND